MVKKLICFSFEKESVGGMATICNGVNCNKPGHFSKCIAITKEAFLAACKDKLLFNDYLGVDIRNGWQNALGDAIEPYLGMKEEFDPAIALKTSSELEVKLAGEEEIAKKTEELEKINDQWDEIIEKSKKTKKKGVKKNDKGRTDSPAESGEVTGSTDGTEPSDK